MQFAGFTEADFDAYLPARASSHAYNRPRLEAKQKVLAVARALHEDAARAALGLEVRASEEFPSVWNKKLVTAQWVFFWRDAEARKKLEEVLDQGRTLTTTLTDPTPYFRHAFLALYLDTARVEVTLKVHGDAWVDVKNLRARNADPARRAELLAALRALPDDFRVGVTGGTTVVAREIDDAALGATLDALVDSSQWWFVARTIERADAVARGEALGEELVTAFRALLPVYQLVAWADGNDLVSIDRELAAAREAREANAHESAAREAAWKAQHDAEIERRREAAIAEARERLASLEPARPAAVQAAVAAVAPPVARRQDTAPPRPREPSRGPAERPERVDRPPRGDRRPSEQPPAARPKDAAREAPRSERPKAPKPVAAPPVETAAAITPGSRVKIQTGPLAGKIGTVTEVDARGFARVTFGLLTARLLSSELVAVAEG